MRSRPVRVSGMVGAVVALLAVLGALVSPPGERRPAAHAQPATPTVQPTATIGQPTATPTTALLPSPTPMVQPALTPAGADAALVRELAERLLSPPVPFAPGGGEAPRAQLLPGALPADLPVQLPQPAGGRLLGSVVRPLPRPGPAGPVPSASIEVVYDVPGAVSDVLAAYERSLMAAGWTAPTAGRGFQPGGFLPSAGQTGITVCRGESGPFLSVTGIGRQGAPVDLRLRLETAGPGPCGGPPLPPPPPPPPMDLLPPLRPPTGVQVQPSGGGGSPFLRSSDALAETTMSVGALEAHYAQQLLAAGWIRRAGQADGPLAWSLWTPPGEGDRTGLLTVQEGPGSGRRMLHLQVATDPAQAGAGGWYGYGTTTVIAPVPTGPLPTTVIAPPMPATAVPPTAVPTSAPPATPTPTP